MPFEQLPIEVVGLIIKPVEHVSLYMLDSINPDLDSSDDRVDCKQ